MDGSRDTHVAGLAAELVFLTLGAESATLRTSWAD